jgi:hypothetical protein
VTDPYAKHAVKTPEHRLIIETTKDTTVVGAAVVSIKNAAYHYPNPGGRGLAIRKKPHVTYVAFEAVIPVKSWFTTSTVT